MMRWAVRLLSCQPAVQARAQAELDTVCGRGLDVTWDQRGELPFLTAVTREVQRFADIAPTGLLHKAVYTNIPGQTWIKDYFADKNIKK